MHALMPWLYFSFEQQAGPKLRPIQPNFGQIFGLLHASNDVNFVDDKKDIKASLLVSHSCEWH